MRAIKRLSEKCITRLREEIEDAGGNEVFALGYLDGKGLVVKIEIAARGNENSVLALKEKFNRPGENPDSGVHSPDVFIHNHPSGFLTPSDNDLLIASKAAEAGIGAFIVDNPVESVYVIAEPTRRRPLVKLDSEKIAAALEEGGAIAQRLSHYETREAQLNLTRLIIRGFNENALTAAEAGTGVGKSFAYLIPALSYALDNDERIVISTATITLQQQLYEKDIPMVVSAMKKNIKVTLMKGRGNYLCRRRLEDALREPFLDDDENEELRSICAWAETTRTGSRSDLSFMPSEGLWSRICSEADLCMGMRCPERERCFVLALRKESADARILVVNHHLLFADLAARREGAGYDGTVVLPPYARVIIDEAHTIEGAATSFFSKGYSRPGIYRQLGRLYRRRRGNATGLLLRIAAMISFSASGEEEDALALAVQHIRDTAAALDEAALELCRGEGVFRLTLPRENLVKTVLVPHFIGLRKQIAALTDLIQDMLEKLPSDKDDDPAVWETKSILRRLGTVGTLCGSFIEFKEHPGEVMWIERRGGGDKSAGSDWAMFIITPIDVAPSLKEALFEPNKTVICVSATLTVAGSFAYWNSRCGLKLMTGRKVLTGLFPSPFPYAASVLLAIPRDAPLPGEDVYRAFVDQAVTKLAETAGGSALILFTSYEALKSAYAAAVPVLRNSGIRCLKQGDDDRNRLLSAFLQDETSVLFATDSFWEGVDAPGDTLRLVILCRLPFRTPTDPVFEARREALEKKGGNSFMELSIPESVMKFKQGFGRLMRRSSDHGVVAVLDGRVLKKRYGEYFLRSLPETRRSFSEFETILRATEGFLFP